MSAEQAGIAVGAVAGRLGVDPTVEGFADVPDDAVAAELARCVLAGIDLSLPGAVDRTMGLSPFGPVVDDVLLSATPATMIAAGAGPEVELIVGSNRDELNLYTVLVGMGVPDRWALRQVVGRLHPDPDALIDAYHEAGRGQTATELFAAIGTDAVFAVPSLRLAQAHAERGIPCWRYEFGWPSPGHDGRLGACHGVELPFVFDGVGRIDYADLAVPEETETRELAADLHRRWVSFATTGDPGWTPFETSRPEAFGIGAVFSTRHEEQSLWDGLI